MHFPRLVVMLPLLATLVGCGKAAVPAAPALPIAPPATAVGVSRPAEAVEASAIITSHTGRVTPSVSAARGPLTAPEAAELAPAASPEAASLLSAPALVVPDEDDPPSIAAFLATEDPPSYNVDDRTPYNVVIPERSAHTTTIAWHTEVPTRAIIEYGRAWGFKKNGYTHKFVDDVAKTDHQITLTELRRWTGYVYRVTAVTPLGLKFPEQERKFRTKFWSWR